MAFTNQVDTLTLEDIVPNVADTVLRSNALTLRVMTKDTRKFNAATQDFPINFSRLTSIPVALVL